MPCWLVKTQTIDMTKVNPEILAAALRALGSGYASVNMGVVSGYVGRSSVQWSGGKLTVNGETDAEIADVQRQVRKGYAAQAFKAAATKAGFKVQVTVDGKLLATKARYGN